MAADFARRPGQPCRPAGSPAGGLGCDRAMQAGLARMDPGLDAEEAVDATIWAPEYSQPGGPGGLGT